MAAGAPSHILLNGLISLVLPFEAFKKAHAEMVLLYLYKMYSFQETNVSN